MVGVIRADSPSASPTGYTCYMEPQVQEGDGQWTARYPEADWSVSAVAGVYAMNNELYRELLLAGTPEADVHRAFEEAEQKRLLGESYTLADYLRGRA